MNTKASLLGLLTATLLSSTAFAADVYSGKDSIKDGGVFTPVSSNRSGFYVNGALGYSWTDRDVSGEVSGEKYKLPEDPEVEGAVELFEKEHWLNYGGSEEIDSPILGAGISYLFHMPSSRFGIEIGLDGTYYTENETKKSFGGFADGYNHNFPSVGEESEFKSNDETIGSFRFKRDFDLDLVLKGHYFVTDRWSLYAGGGVSWARASAKGSHFSGNVDDPEDGPTKIYPNSFDQDESAFGYVLALGSRAWLTERLYFDLDYTFKKHDFDFSSATSTTDLDEGYRRVSGNKLDVEDEVHAVKAKIGFKLN